MLCIKSYSKTIIFQFHNNLTSEHYSDGVGRAGTYVLIDMVLNRMAKGCKEIDIAATLEHIRDQRSGMVQTRPQFEFCLMAVAEEVHAILKALLPWTKIGSLFVI